MNKQRLDYHIKTFRSKHFQLKGRNEGTFYFIDFRFFLLSGAPKIILRCEKQLFCPVFRIWGENPKTAPN